MKSYDDLSPFAKVLLFPINLVVVGTILVFMARIAIWVFCFAWGIPQSDIWQALGF
jgi:hypothetical protein